MKKGLRLLSRRQRVPFAVSRLTPHICTYLHTKARGHVSRANSSFRLITNQAETDLHSDPDLLNRVQHCFQNGCNELANLIRSHELTDLKTILRPILLCGDARLEKALAQLTPSCLPDHIRSRLGEEKAEYMIRMIKAISVETCFGNLDPGSDISPISLSSGACRHTDVSATHSVLVSLSPGHWEGLSGYDDINRHDILEVMDRSRGRVFGLVVARTSDELTLALEPKLAKGKGGYKSRNPKALGMPWWQGTLRVRRHSSLVPWDRQFDALLSLIADHKAPHPMQRLLLDREFTVAEAKTVMEMDDDDMLYHSESLYGLNDAQRAALLAAMQRQLTLIQGPPGTGKTFTAARIALGWVAQRGGQVLVVADSNLAADNLLKAIATVDPGVRAVRVGQGTYLTEHTPEAIMEREGVQDHHQILASADIVCTTCVGAGHELLQGRNFRRVLIDEASQATEMSSLVALAASCERLVLVGDHKQLPPTVCTSQAKELGLETSMFERLLEWGCPSTLLTIQYRLPRLLAEFSSRHFYDSRLHSVDRAEDALPGGFPWPGANGVAFVDIPDGREAMEAMSWYNTQEADVVSAVVASLVQAGKRERAKNTNSDAGGALRACDIGVVTGYRSQTSRIVRALKKRSVLVAKGNRLQSRQFLLPEELDEHCEESELASWGEQDDDAVDVSTVDGYQGMQREVMVCSAVRSSYVDDESPVSIGFLRDERRLNVMLTRARRGLVICGNEKTLRQAGGIWAAWLEWADSHGAIIRPDLSADSHTWLQELAADAPV